MASVVNEAVQWVGKISYDFGSSDYFDGGKSDCSAFVQNVFKQCGISLPRTTGEQWGNTTVPEVKKEDLQPGDLVFFYGTWDSNYVDNVSHVGIYMGNDKFVHALLDDENSRCVEKVQLFINQKALEENNGYSYNVKRGQSLLYNVFKI